MVMPAGVRLVAALAAASIPVASTSVAVLAGALSDSGSSAAVASLVEAAESCAVTGPVVGLSGEQAQNASVVVSTAMADSAEDPLTARIALMTAWTESRLRDLGPMPGAADSLGIFQQRASQGWGTPVEEMDLAEATAMFVRRLVAVPAWDRKAPWVAAQEVQRSRFAGAGNYKASWNVAGAYLAAVLRDGDVMGGCGQGPAGGLAGPGAARGLPDGYVVPAGTPPAHAGAVRFALAQLGKPYVWGAAGPKAYDCSGLTQAAWAVSGVRLLHYTVDQWHEGQSVVPAAATAGDLVLTPGSDPPGPGLPGHVGIYLGFGLVVSAVDSRVGVAVQTWSEFVAGGLEAVIDPAPGR
jgi:cell wall-associated NlpC family hydrolase